MKIKWNLNKFTFCKATKLKDINIRYLILYGKIFNLLKMDGC